MGNSIDSSKSISNHIIWLNNNENNERNGDQNTRDMVSNMQKLRYSVAVEEL